MILRFRSKDGTTRLDVNPTDDVSVILQKLSEAWKNADPRSFAIAKEPAPPAHQKYLLAPMVGTQVEKLALKHGDLVFVFYDDIQLNGSAPTTHVNGETLSGDVPMSETTESSSSPVTLSPPSATQNRPRGPVKQDPVDDFLDTQDGKIPRKRDPKMCKHGEKGMCDYCMPLEPYDQKYLEERKIKHLSFHSYLRKLHFQKNKEQGSSYISPLSEEDYRVKVPCPSGHPPWPEAICSKCQPSAITLSSQPFRMVDHLEFADQSIVNDFIQYWRVTGHQRLGIMYGRYEPYTEVPLGIKAVVEAIYEPPQGDENDGAELTLPWGNEKDVDHVAKLCGLQKVGLIFTDLTDDGTGSGTVVCKRHINSFYLSATDVYQSSLFQNLHKSPSKWSETGFFGSKFITACVSGDPDGNISVSAYQASHTAMAMVQADIIVPSTDPSVMLVQEEAPRRYVPEVFFRKINEYGANVQENAKPGFPVDYLLVTLTHGFRTVGGGDVMFSASKEGIGFVVENREGMGVRQEIRDVARQVGVSGRQSETRGLFAVSDFHLLTYLYGLGVLSEDDWEILVRTATKKQVQDGIKLLETSGWQTLMEILRSST